MKNYEINYENNQEGGREPENLLRFELTNKIRMSGKKVLKGQNQIKQENKLQFIFIMNIINDITKKFVDILKLNKAPADFSSSDAFLLLKDQSDVTKEDKEFIRKIFNDTNENEVNSNVIMQEIKNGVVEILKTILRGSQTGGATEAELERKIETMRQSIQQIEKAQKTPKESLEQIRTDINNIIEEINSDNDITPDKKSELKQKISDLEKRLSDEEQQSQVEPAPAPASPPASPTTRPPPPSTQDDPKLVEPNETNFRIYILPGLKNYIENINIKEITNQIFNEEEKSEFEEEYKKAYNILQGEGAAGILGSPESE